MRALACAVLAVGACAGGGTEGSAAHLREEAKFGSLSWVADWGGPLPPEGCPADRACRGSVTVSAAGAIDHSDGRETLSGTVPEPDLRHLAALAVSAPVVAELTKRPPCPFGTHMTEAIQVEIAPSLFAFGETVGCQTGPVQALRGTIQQLATKVFPQSRIPVDPPREEIPLRPARIDVRAAFHAFFLQRGWGPCPPGKSCTEEISVDTHLSATNWVSYSLEGRREMWNDVPDVIRRFGAVAVRPDVIAELRKPMPCGFVTDVGVSVQVVVAPAMYVRAKNVAGCTSGPIAELVAAARAMVDELRGTARDAGPDDHPPDNRAP